MSRVTGNPLRTGSRAQAPVFEESGHFPFVEEPKRFLEVVREWIAER